MAGFYTPNAKFAFPRSYAYKLVVQDQSPNITRVGNNIHTNIDPSVGYGIWYILNPAIWTWSSNRYTLDYIVRDCYWEYGFDGVHHVQDFGLAWNVGTYQPRTFILLNNPYLITNQVTFTLDPAPPNYWTPTP